MDTQDRRSSGGDMIPQIKERVNQILDDIIQTREANYPQTLARLLKEQCDIQLKETRRQKQQLQHQDMNGQNPNAQCPKPYFKQAELNDQCKRIALNAVLKAYTLYCAEDEMAKCIRIELNEKLKGLWHVIVGKHFASFFTYTPGAMAHMQLGDLQFLVYQYQ
ncbi:unnamed protein product [Schistocephalus solidus]|uniref:Dynein light chain n=1 Tax=Schistocephalus solidus TaxID=70667 RepID=A0A183SE97_SCHSO|nr:unnamed protein product [Schistocephalus solidus]